MTFDSPLKSDAVPALGEMEPANQPGVLWDPFRRMKRDRQTATANEQCAGRSAVQAPVIMMRAATSRQRL